jgi:hypothetical protein
MQISAEVCRFSTTQQYNFFMETKEYRSFECRSALKYVVFPQHSNTTLVSRPTETCDHHVTTSIHHMQSTLKPAVGVWWWATQDWTSNNAQAPGHMQSTVRSLRSLHKPQFQVSNPPSPFLHPQSATASLRSQKHNRLPLHLASRYRSPPGRCHHMAASAIILPATASSHHNVLLHPVTTGATPHQPQREQPRAVTAPCCSRPCLLALLQLLINGMLMYQHALISSENHPGFGPTEPWSGQAPRHA